MLKIVIPPIECYDESANHFFYIDETVLKLEHSLVSLSLWESKWKKPFISSTNKSVEETIDYIKCMTIDADNIPSVVWTQLNDDIIDRVDAYIGDSMTATTFSGDSKKGGRRQIITNEVIYYWMFSLGIPKECETWHLNRLLTLIRVCSEKNAPKKKLSTREALSRQRAINEARRKALNTKG